MNEEILKLGAPDGKFKVVSPNSKRIYIGDVLVMTKGSIQKPSRLLFVLRPKASITSEEILVEARKLDFSNGGRLEVFSPAETKADPEDILLVRQEHEAYPDKPIAILRPK